MLIPLISVCQFVLSPRNLPNYVCDESVERYVNDRSLDVVTAEVRFLSDGGYYSDHDSNIKIDGEPLLSRRQLFVGFWTILFATKLTTIFVPSTPTESEFKRVVKSESGRAALFDFQLSRMNNSTFRSDCCFGGYSGTITVDLATGQLQSVTLKLTDRDPRMTIATRGFSLACHQVSVPDLGQILVPDHGQSETCERFRHRSCQRADPPDGSLWRHIRIRNAQRKGGRRNLGFASLRRIVVSREDAMKGAGPAIGKIRTIIVDDEPLARSNLTALLRPHPEIEIVAECDSGREALSVIRARKPDLVYLDVQMPVCDGFDVIEMLGSDAVNRTGTCANGRRRGPACA